jgi:hypothetical protein
MNVIPATGNWKNPMTPIETNPEKNLPLDAALTAFTQQALGLAFPQSSFANTFSETVQEHFHYPHYIFWRNSKTAGIAATAAALRAHHGDIRAAAFKILDDALPELPAGQRLPTAKTIGNTLSHKTLREPNSILADNFEGMPQEFAWACLQLANQPDKPKINNAKTAGSLKNPEPETRDANSQRQKPQAPTGKQRNPANHDPAQTGQCPANRHYASQLGTPKNNSRCGSLIRQSSKSWEAAGSTPAGIQKP